VAERMRSFWSRWYAKLIVVLAIVLVVLVGASLVAAKYTESNHFCIKACHEMQPYGDTWAHSKHGNIACVHCHIGPGVWNLVKAKVSALREVWVHFTGVSSKPFAVTRHIPNSICQASGCHPAGTFNRVTIAFPRTGGASFSHDGHTKGPRCIDCHSQVVHTTIPGRAYIPPQSMASCFRCHTNGTRNCVYCHNKPPHGNRGPCQNCHSIQSFFGGKNFKHPQPLVGTHAQILCEQCHTQGVMVKPDGCVNCHGDQHNGLPMCVTCHVLAHFVPANFKHPQEGPHIPAGDEPLQCNACHANGFKHASCPCHGGNPPSGGG
jgi:nitrate/TMAO reductase-like tetraheme cytochrome c subunit